MAVEPPVGVEDERDVAVGTAPGQPAGAAVDGRSDAAAVEQQDRLASVLLHGAELCEERPRERVAGLPAEVDDADRRQPADEAPSELEPLQPFPALRPGRRGAEDRDGVLERSPLGCDGARVVARVGVLLVGRVVLLVDADHAERRDRREDRRSGANDDRRRPARDPHALVPPFRLRQRRVEDRDPVAEPRAQAAYGLRRERDLRHEHDRALSPLERRGAGLEVDLRLAAAGRSVEEDVAAASVERLDDAGERALLALAQPCRLGLAAQRVPLRRLRPLTASLPLGRRHQFERPRRGRAVVVREPQREIDERLRQLVDHVADRRRLHAFGRALLQADDHAAPLGPAEANRDHRSLADLGRNLVRERPRHRPRRDERVDGGVRHRLTVASEQVGGVLVRFACQWERYALSSPCKVTLTNRVSRPYKETT